jgi:cell division protein FtsI/penicillin-binding protein 2
MNSKIRLRVRFVLIVLCLFATVIAAKLYDTQIVKGQTYAHKADAQYARPASGIFDRGSIFFETKDGTDVAAASVAQGYFLYFNPKQVTDPTQELKALSEYVSIDKTVFNKGMNASSSYIQLNHRLASSTAASISSLKLAGFGVLPEGWRSYPGLTLAAHTLGILGQDASSTLKGRYGLERSYDDVLYRPAQGSAATSFAGLFSGSDDQASSSSDEQGDIVTTIEPSVEAYVEKVLTDTSAQWHPDEIGGIVMDPRTGEIHALSSLPTFDPNDLSHISNVSILSNPLVEHVYEMGSIMKPLTMAVGIDTGAVTRTSTYDDVGCMTLDKKKICNYDGKARGVIPMQEVLSQSLNIGAATIALKVGKDGMASYFTSFGLGSTTNVDLPNEANGLIGNLTKKGKDIDVATASYGQGIAVSPVEMARALSILANGGYLITPHVTKEIDYVDGSKKTIDWPKTGPVLKAKTLSDVDDMLITVVDTKLANGKLKMDHYTIGAKTGTAEIADHVNGGYYKDRYLHSFFGFFPAYNPQFIVFLYQIYPKGAQYASETLTQPFSDIAKFLINYYNIPPDR